MPTWVAPAIEAAGAVATSATSGLFGMNQAAKNRSFQERMYYQQLKDNRENWERMNAYNDPSAVLARMKRANLNPLLMYEGGQSMTAGSPSESAKAPSGAQANASFNNPFAGFSANMKAMEMMQAEIDKIKAETNKTQSETDWQEIENRFSRDTYGIRYAILHHDDERLQVEMQKMRSEIVNSGMITSQQLQSMIQARQYEVKRFNLDFDTIGTQLKQGWSHLANENLQARASWKSASAMMLNAVSDANLKTWQIGSIAQGLLFDRQLQPYRVKGLSLDNRLKQWDLRLKKAALDEKQQNILNMTLKNLYYGRYGSETPFEFKYLKDIRSLSNMIDSMFILPWQR